MTRRKNRNFPVLAVLGRRVVSDSYRFTSAVCVKECSERDSPESMSYLACVPCRENENVQVIHIAADALGWGSDGGPSEYARIKRAHLEPLQ